MGRNNTLFCSLLRSLQSASPLHIQTLQEAAALPTKEEPWLTASSRHPGLEGQGQTDGIRGAQPTLGSGPPPPGALWVPGRWRGLKFLGQTSLSGNTFKKTLGDEMLRERRQEKDEGGERVRG